MTFQFSFALLVIHVSHVSITIRIMQIRSTWSLVLITIVTLPLVVVSTEKQYVTISEKYREIDAIAGEDIDATLKLDKSYNIDTVNLDVQYISDAPNVIQSSSLVMVSVTNSSYLELKLKSQNPGVVTLVMKVNSSDPNVDVIIPNANLFFRITVGRSRAIYYVSAIFGWFYVVAWNLSFYPQIIDNFKRKRYITKIEQNYDM